MFASSPWAIDVASTGGQEWGRVFPPPNQSGKKTKNESNPVSERPVGPFKNLYGPKLQFFTKNNSRPKKVTKNF
jgi:hypothetical protein